MAAANVPWYRTQAGRSWLAAILGVLVVAAAVTGYVMAVLAGEDTGSRTRFLIIGGLCSAVPVIVATVNQVRQERSRRRADEIQAQAEAKLVVTLGAALSPVLRYLGKIAVERNRAEKHQLAGLLVQAVVDAAAGVCGPNQPNQTRGVFFKRAGRTLECVGYAGRAEPTTRVFSDEPADLAGRHAFELLRNEEVALYEDVTVNAPPGFTTSKSYRTLIAAAVIAGDVPHGMLTVDAPEPSTLTGEDLEIVKVLATLLGTGLAMSP